MEPAFRDVLLGLMGEYDSPEEFLWFIEQRQVEECEKINAGREAESIFDTLEQARLYVLDMGTP